MDPEIGDVVDGYRFMGGDPSQESSWRPVARTQTYANGRPRGLTNAEQKELAVAREAARDALAVLPDLERFGRINQDQVSGGLFAVPFADRVVGAIDSDVSQLNEISARLAPAQREPGSGTTSDRDLALFLQAVPSVQRPRAANAALIERGRAEGRRRQAYADFLDRYAAENGTLSGADEVFRAKVANGEIDLAGYGQSSAAASGEGRAGPINPDTGLPTYPGITALTAGAQDYGAPAVDPNDPRGPPPGPDYKWDDEEGAWVKRGFVEAGDTPNSLSASGYVYDAKTDTWRRGWQGDSPEETVADHRKMSGPLRQVEAFGRGAADTITFGFGDEIGAGLDAVFGSSDGSRTIWDGTPIQDAYRNNVAVNRGIARADEQDAPVARISGQVAGAVLAPGAAASGRFIAQAPRLRYAMTRGAAVGTGYGAGYGAGSAEGGVAERAEGAAKGGVAGMMTGAALPPVSRAAGYVASPIVRPIRNLMTGGGADERAVRSIFQGVDPNDVAATAGRFRAQGVEPTLADAGGSVVQSRVRVAATKQTPGRQVAEDFASSRRGEVQDYAASLGERISPIRGTPDQLNDALATAQRRASGPAFDAARASPDIDVPVDLRAALSSPEAKSAMRSASRLYASSADPTERALSAELGRLASGRTAPRRMSVGAADLVSRHLQKAGGFGTNEARVFGGLGTGLRQAARDQTPAYDSALEGYAQRARLGDATEVGERFVGNRGYAQDFAESVGQMSPDERSVAQAAARAAVEREAGVAGRAPRLLDDFAVGRNMSQRAGALMGPEGAASLREGGQVGRMMTQTGNAVNPRAGSNTFLNQEDGSALKAGSVVGNLLGGRPVSAIGGVVDLLRSAGMRSDEAEAITRMALDPARTDEAIRLATQRLGPTKVGQIMEQVRQMAIPYASGQAGAATAR